MTEQEINNLIDSKIGKTKMSQLPEATQTSGLYSIGYTGNQSVKYKANLLQGDPLTVRKTYQTEALALADKNPIDPTTSLPLTVGQFVSIVDDGEKNGIYRISSISGGGTMSLELQGKLGDLTEYTKTGGSTKTTKDIDDTKADHGYVSSPKTLKQVEDNASVKIKNLAENGDFRDGLTGWTRLWLSASISEGVVTLSNFTESNGRLYKEGIAFNAGKYFMKARIRSVGDVAPDYINLGYLDSSSINIVTISSPNKGEWYNIVGVGDIPSGTGRFPQFTIAATNNEGVVVEIDRNIGVSVINLTETFGAGNEPTTEEMDLLISTLGADYFEGEITIPAQKVMQWQQLLIDSKASHGYESNPKMLKEVDDEKADHGYESNPKTLKEVDDEKADSSLLSVVELIGDNDNYVIGDPIKGVINGRKYRLWLKNKDIDMSGVSYTTPGYLVLKIYLQSTTEQIDLHTVGAHNRVMQHYYDFSIPDDGIQYTLGINIRATLGEQAIFVLEAITNEEDDLFYKVRNVGIIPSGNPGYIHYPSSEIKPSTINLYRFIKIKSGEKVVLKCRVGNGTSAISFAQDLEATTIVQKIRGLGDTIDGVYEYVATENGYVVISWLKDYPVNVRIYSQEDYNINQFSNIYFNRKPVDATFTSGYINLGGSIVNSEKSHYSSPILLHKGETVWVYSMGYDVTAIAITTENGETYKPVAFYPDEPVLIGRNFKYTATEDVYVSVSGRVEGFRAEITSLNLPKNDGSHPKLLQYSRQLETEWNSWETNNYSLSSLKMKKEAGKLPMTMGYYFSDYPQRNGKLYFSPTLLGKPELIVDFNDNSGLTNTNLERSVIAVSPKHNSVITGFFDRSPGQGLKIYEDSTFAHVNKEEPMQAWLYNSGLEFVNDAEGNEYCIYGEYSHGLKPTRRIFKGNYPYSNPDNWRVVHTFPSDETEGSILHIHQIQKDPFSDFIYCTTGDYGPQSQVHYSADLGETWNILIEDKPQGYLRMINFIFLENEIYWASDDNRHYLFRATRDENGLLDPESVELVANLPVRQSTNSSAYIKEKNCLFFYDRISPDYEGEPITTCIYDIEKKELIEVGKLFPRKTNPPLGLWGNRGKCYVHYPNSADRRLAMGIVDEYAPCNFDFIGNDGKTFGTVIYELI